MLIPHDDLLVHQSPRPLAYTATTDLRFFERCYFNIHDPQGRFSLVTGLGAYPNMHSMDGFACAVVEGDPRQHNSRFFRTLGNDRVDTQVGPLHFEVLEPMRRWALRLEENPYGIAFDLEMEGRFEPWESHLVYQDGAAMLFDQGHYVQSCLYRGTVSIDGKSHDLDHYYGVRDRSWGVRPLSGIPVPGGATAPYSMHMWINVQLEDSSYFIFTVEDAEGTTLRVDGGIAGGARDGRKWVSIEHDLSFMDGIRVMTTGTLKLVDDTGEEYAVEITRALPGILMNGAGYGTTQGAYRGDVHEGETWQIGDVSVDDLGTLGADGGMTDVLARFEVSNGDVGYGLMEYSFGAKYPTYPPRITHEDVKRLKVF